MKIDPHEILLGNKGFQTRLKNYIKLYDKLDANLLKDYNAKNIPTLSEKIKETRKILLKEILHILEIHRESHTDDVTKLLHLSEGFCAKMEYVNQIRRFKYLAVKKQKYDVASRLRNREIELFGKLNLQSSFDEINLHLTTIIKAPQNVFEYYTLVYSIIDLIKTHITIDDKSIIDDLKSICIKWLLTDVSHKMKLISKKEFTYSMARINELRIELEKNVKLKI